MQRRDNSYKSSIKRGILWCVTLFAFDAFQILLKSHAWIEEIQCTSVQKFNYFNALSHCANLCNCLIVQIQIVSNALNILIFILWI